MQDLFRLVVDGSFSVVMDTLVLPYTVSRQMKEGNIAVNREGRR